MMSFCKCADVKGAFDKLIVGSKYSSKWVEWSLSKEIKQKLKN